MEFVFDEGGRSEAGYEGRAGDCVTSATWNRLVGVGSPPRRFDQGARYTYARGATLRARGQGLKTITRQSSTASSMTP